jgi:hypothetical protein
MAFRIYDRASLGQPKYFNTAEELQSYLETPNVKKKMANNPIQFTIADETGASVPASSWTPPSQPSTQPPVVPPTPLPVIPPGGGPITPDQNIQPLPNIPGLSNPGTPVNTATVPSTDISPYLPTTSQQQQDIINQSIAQSQGVGQQNVQSLQDILGPYVQSQVKNWTDPNSPDYQSTIGALNNVGRADAGTFGQSLASRLAPLIGQNMMTLGTNALQPSFTTQQGLVNTGAGTQSNLGLASLQRFIDQQNFQQQATLANQLADKGQPSSAQNAVGMGSSILSSLGSFGQGLGGFKQIAGTWICTHLKKLGLATIEEVEHVHIRLRPSIFRHPIHWITYLVNAPHLIVLCDVASVDWKAVKEVLVNQVLAEPDSEKAWQIYRAECQRLTLQYAPELWTLEIV